MIQRLSHVSIYVLDQDSAYEFYLAHTDPRRHHGRRRPETADRQKTYEALRAKGVEFMYPPTARFYGIEALFKYDSGNWFSMTERKGRQS